MATLPGLDHVINRGGDRENDRKQTEGIEINARKHRDNRRIKPIQRQRKLLESKVEECHELKTEVQELKFERGDGEEDIKAWSVEIEKRLTEYEKVVGGLEDLEWSLREENTREIQEKEEKSKWEIKKKFEVKADGKEGDAGKPKAKLP